MQTAQAQTVFEQQTPLVDDTQALVQLSDLQLSYIGGGVGLVLFD